MAHDADAAHLLEAAARAAAEGGVQTRTIRCQLEVTVTEEEWQAAYAALAAASRKLKEPGDDREFMRNVDVVADEIVNTGVIGAGMMLVGSQLGAIVGGYQYMQSKPMGATVATMMAGTRIVRFQFLPEPDKG